MPKEIIRKGKQALGKKREKDLFRPGYAMKVAKRLNGLGLAAAICMYTLGVCALTVHFMGPSKTIPYDAKALSDLGKEVKELRLELLSQDNKREKVLREIRGRDKTLREEMANKISRLANNIHTAKPKKEFKTRIPSAMSHGAKSEGSVLVYNEVNKDVLQKKQELELKRLKVKLKNKASSYLKKVDLRDPKQQALYADLQDDMVIEIEKLRSMHNEQLTQFRKQNYIIID